MGFNAFSFRRLGRAFYHRNFRLYSYGQSVSLIGNFMQRTALAWLVYRLSNSAALLGTVDFIGQIPNFFLTPFVGVLLDRWNIYRLICITQALAMLQAVILGILVFTDSIAIWHVFILSGLNGLISAFDIPARQTFFIHLVDGKEDLGNAIAINAATLNSARIIGPSIAGVAIALLGEGLCFILNGFSFLAVLISLWKMQVKISPTTKVVKNVLEELKDGFSYAFTFRRIRNALMLLGIGSIMGMPVMILLPIFARDILAGGPQTFGILFSAFGAGALAGTMYLVSRQDIQGIERNIAFAAMCFGGGIVAFSLSKELWLSLVLIFFAGMGMVVQNSSINTLLQNVVDEDKRGRVMSLYVTFFSGLVPFGSLGSGTLASMLGADNTLLLGGSVCVFSGLVYYAVETRQSIVSRM